jgi:hypothetical protein
MAEHLSFNPLTSEWNLNISLPTSDMKSSKSTPGSIQRRTDNNKQEMHYYCYLTFRVPATKLSTCMCITNEIRSCSDSWEDAEVKARCEAHTARVCSGPDTYRNRNCLLCNHLDDPKPSYYAYDGPNPPEIPSFTKLLHWRRLKTGACASSEIHDPLSCTCCKLFI